MTHINQDQQNVLSLVFTERQLAQMEAELAKAMKAGMRRLAAGVSVVSAIDQQGTRFAMTASSVTSVSDNPPSLLVCINQNARICPVLTVGQAFAVNILEQTHTEVSIVCSTGDQGDKRFNIGHWSMTGNNTPILADAAVVFECTVDLVQPYGTHNVIIAKIDGVMLGNTPFDPLIYCDGGYRRFM